MAHFAQLDLDNYVVQVIVIANEDIIDPETGKESEALGIRACQTLVGANTRWLQTSYNNNFRASYAGVGSRYDESLDAFIPPRPALNPSWVFDSDLFQWKPPYPAPDDGLEYFWDEDTTSWILFKETTDPDPAWLNDPAYLAYIQASLDSALS